MESNELKLIINNDLDDRSLDEQAVLIGRSLTTRSPLTHTNQRNLYSLSIYSNVRRIHFVFTVRFQFIRYQQTAAI
jgi:hypothetical protein